MRRKPRLNKLIYYILLEKHYVTNTTQCCQFEPFFSSSAYEVLLVSYLDGPLSVHEYVRAPSTVPLKDISSITTAPILTKFGRYSSCMKLNQTCRNRKPLTSTSKALDTEFGYSIVQHRTLQRLVPEAKKWVTWFAIEINIGNLKRKLFKVTRPRAKILKMSIIPWTSTRIVQIMLLGPNRDQQEKSFVLHRLRKSSFLICHFNKTETISSQLM